MHPAQKPRGPPLSRALDYSIAAFSYKLLPDYLTKHGFFARGFRITITSFIRNSNDFQYMLPYVGLLLQRTTKRENELSLRLCLQ